MKQKSHINPHWCRCRCRPHAVTHICCLYVVFLSTPTNTVQLSIWVFLYSGWPVIQYVSQGGPLSLWPVFVSAGRNCPCRLARVVAVITERGGGRGLSGQRGQPGFSGGLMQNWRCFSPLLLIHPLPLQCIHDTCLWACVCEWIWSPLPPQTQRSIIVYFSLGSINQLPLEIPRSSFNNSWPYLDFMCKNVSFAFWDAYCLFLSCLFECKLVLCVCISTLGRTIIFPSYPQPNHHN